MSQSSFGNMSSLSGTSVSTSSDSTSKTEHQKLAGIVKAVHAKLRRKYKKDGGFDAMWADHVKNKDLLSEYADAMHHLAVDHWSKHPETRIDWCRNVCLRYFIDGELKRVLEKDARRKAFKAKKGQNGDTQKMQPEKTALSVTDLSSCGAPSDSNKSGILDSRLSRNNSNNCFDVVSGQASSRDVNGVLGSSFDNLQDACNLKCAVNSASQLTEGDDSPTPVFFVADEKQPAESKCEEYLGRLQDCLDQGDCLPSSGESGESSHEQIDQDAVYSKYGPTNFTTITVPVQGKLRLLDVGSCYNPFLQFDEFVAIGIDISPAVESVFSCDFLHLELLEPLQLAQDTHDSWLASLRSPITRLPRDCFHVVVFSLLLEYFPSSYQRWLCCQKAHELLMMNGLLLIITPDSHSVNRGAPQMKSWKIVIESLGFKRYKYEKQDHLHCMAFRKVATEPTTFICTGITPDMLYIPQDFNGADILDEDSDTESRSELEDDELCQNFLELPEFDLF